MTKEDAILILENEQPHCGEKITFTEGERYEAFDMAIKALEQRWIPVSERLPEDDGYYLVTFQRNLLTRTEQYTSISEFREDSWTEFGHVIAWMPLPEPMRLENK